MFTNYWTKDRIKLLKEVYPSCSIDELKRYFPNKNVHTIEAYASRLKIKKIVNNKRKGNLEPLLLDTLESYYWIGYLMADGYLDLNSNKLHLSSSELDKRQMQKFADFINTKIKIYFRPANNVTKFSGKRVTVCVSHKNILDKIIKKFDFKCQKTYNPPDETILEKIFDTEEKFICFLTGFIDGDGHIAKDKTIRLENHSSWLVFFRYIEKQLLKYNYNICSPRVKSRSGRDPFAVWELNTSTFIKIKKIIDVNIPNIFLERKWNK